MEEGVAIPDVQKLTIFVVKTDIQTEHSVIRGDKEKHLKEGNPEGLLEEVTSIQEERGSRREGFRHKGRGTWPPPFLISALGHQDNTGEQIREPSSWAN